MLNLLLLTLLTTAAVGQIAPPPPAFISVRTSDGDRNALTQVATQYEHALSTACPKVELQMQQMQAKVYGPFQLNEKGEILEATWKESIPGTACQQSRLYNAMVTIRQGKSKVVSLFPGHSYAGPLLQRDAVFYAVVATSAGHVCSLPDVLDTTLPNGEPTKAREPWYENGSSASAKTATWSHSASYPMQQAPPSNLDLAQSSSLSLAYLSPCTITPWP